MGKEEPKDAWDQFDPMGVHYQSEGNSYVLGPGGDLNPISELKRDASKKDAASCKLYVRNFNPKLTETGLKNIFQSYGEVKSTIICKSERPFGFVIMKHVDQAVAAIYGLHQRAPHRLFVSFAKEKKANPAPEIDLPEVTPVDDEVVVEKLYPSTISKVRQEFVRDISENPNFNPVASYNRFVEKLCKPQNKYNSVEMATINLIKSMTLEGLQEPLIYNLQEYDKCVYCKHPAMYCCELCTSKYCSVDCQRQDWAAHKLTHSMTTTN